MDDKDRQDLISYRAALETELAAFNAKRRPDEDRTAITAELDRVTGLLEPAPQ